MLPDYEAAYKNIQELNSYYEAQGASNRNEASTRLHLIDTLIFDCLGWGRDDCSPEEPHGGDYSDYSLFAPHRLLIVEAKREGIYFELPAGRNKSVYSIEFFEKTNKAVYGAIKQSLGYCLDRGAPFGCVSNGHQVIAFLGSRTDGVPPLSGKVLVFDSIQAMEDRFFELWQNLSKPGIQAHNLTNSLQENPVPSPPAKLSGKLSRYPGYKNRNDLQNDLQILGDLIIEDLIKSYDKVEFLKQCYCESGAVSQYAILNRRILETRYSALFEQAVGGPTLAPLITKSGVNEQALAESISRRPILLLGDVGVGKTIFIQHFINVTAADLVANAMVFYVDFGVNPTLSEELRPYLSKELTRQLLEIHGVDIEEAKFVSGVYYGDLQRFRRGVYAYLQESNPDEFKRREAELLVNKIADQDSHLKASFEHLSKARKKQIIIILDNIDQRPYEFQQTVFLIGQSMAETWPATVYVSIRPETFYKSKISGALSAYHPKAFTISPPRIDRVIQKRLEYAVGLLNTGQIPGLQGIGVNLNSIKRYLEALHYSFTRSESLVEFVENIAGGNVRLALDLIRTFIGSGHVDTSKITQASNTYLIPLHEFMRAVIHGDHEYYDPSASELMNVFDISSADGKEHFLALIVLAQLDRWGQVPTSSGYSSRATLIEFAQDFGFQLHQVNYTLGRLVGKKLLETNTKVLEDAATSLLHYRVTSVGAFYYKRLVNMFVYVDPMVVDTPIVDPEVRSNISDVYMIRERLERTRVFYNYLLSQWKLVARPELAFDFTDAHTKLLNNIKNIKEGLRYN
jgi:GTPase SAR1 family protein